MKHLLPLAITLALTFFAAGASVDPDDIDIDDHRSHDNDAAWAFVDKIVAQIWILEHLYGPEGTTPPAWDPCPGVNRDLFVKFTDECGVSWRQKIDNYVELYTCFKESYPIWNCSGTGNWWVQLYDPCTQSWVLAHAEGSWIAGEWMPDAECLYTTQVMDNCEALWFDSCEVFVAFCDIEPDC